MRPLKKTDLFNYGILAFPLSIAGLPLYLQAPDLYATERGVSLALMGIVLLGLRFFDAIQDPLIGRLSDRFQRNRNLIMGGGTITLCIGLFALMNPPAEAGIIWFSIWIALSATAYSIATINLNTVGGLWSSNRFERTRIVTIREGLAISGVLFGVVTPAVLALWLGRALGFQIFSLIIAAILLLAWIRYRRWSREHNPSSAVSQMEAQPTAAHFASFPKESGTRKLLFVSQLGALASAFPAVLFLLFVRERLGMDEWSWLFLLLYFGAAIVGFSFCKNLSRKVGKVAAWRITIWGSIIAFSGALFAGENSGILFGIVCLGSGFFLGGDVIFPNSLMADRVGKNTDGRRTASSAFAWLSFIYKFALGLAAAVAFSVLEFVGFKSGTTHGAGVLMVLTFLYAALPIILKIATALLLKTWQQNLEGNEIYEKTNSNELGSDRCHDFST
jgi:Na+/melibiose symporter-like transporter|tara:strand:+ start:338 stop:1675 length:1338 start_codon:yes stop_codon:yes gene_type:complete